MKADIRIEKIHPEQADTLLQSRFEAQRPLRETAVLRLLSDMQSGRFHLGPDALVLIKGRLANGQHRLEAVKRFGKPVSFIVLESNDDELYKVIDCGLRRTVGDALVECKYHRMVPAIARWVRAYDNGTINPSDTKPVRSLRGPTHILPTQTDMIDFCQENMNGLVQAAEFVNPLYEKTRVIPCSIGGSLYFISLREKLEDRALDFLTQIYEGGPSGPANDMRNRMLLNRSSKAKLPQGYVFGLTLKAYNAFLKGVRPGVLKWVKGEELPVIQGNNEKVDRVMNMMAAAEKRKP